MAYPYLIFDEIAAERLWRPGDPAPDVALYPPAHLAEVPMADPTDPTAPAPVAVTAGEQDHSDPWVFAGEPADPPADTGRPAEEPT